MPAKDSSFAAKAATGVAGAAAAFGARKLLIFAWTKTTGHKPPDKAEDISVTLGQAVAWALLIGATVSVARVLAVRVVASRADRRPSLPAD
jgi:hypothetical protein